jgi:glycosyltransferase involved in cell wall biosynthesis
MSAGRLLRAPAAGARGAAVRALTRSWEPHSHLFVLGDALGWALDDEASYVSGVAIREGYTVGPPAWARLTRGQVVFHTSHFAALDPLWTGSSHRLGMAYFHGRPGTPGYPEFDRAFESLRRDPERFARIQVTHRELEEIVLTAGVEPGRVHRIPIGIELERFAPVDDERRRAARDELGVPDDAFVIGSFQKDGVGMGDGLEPKTIKGPDVLVEALDAAHRSLDELVVLLTGPARGYVRAELTRRGIPHVHQLLPTRDGLTTAYRALDAYLVASRQEGGPKSILESMAAGVPLVTTRAGQAPDLVADGVNGILCEVEDAHALAAGLVRIHGDSALVARLRAAGRATAAENSHERLAPRWAALLEGFAERADG